MYVSFEALYILTANRKMWLIRLVVLVSVRNMRVMSGFGRLSLDSPNSTIEVLSLAAVLSDMKSSAMSDLRD